MGKLGKLAADGTTETEADVCVITGRDVLGQHSVQQRIAGTPYFYRYLSDFQRLLTDELRAEIAAQIPQESNATSDKPDKAKIKSNQVNEVEK